MACTTVLATAALAASLTFAPATQAPENQWVDYLWAQFPEEVHDVYETLDAAGQVVFAGIAGDYDALVLWHGPRSELTIVLDGKLVDDLDVWEEYNELHFAGLWIDDREPLFFGLVTTDALGHIVLDFESDGLPRVRLLIEPIGGDVVALATCVCHGTGNTRSCTDAECDKGECCSTGPGACSAYCRWRAGEVTFTGGAIVVQ